MSSQANLLVEDNEINRNMLTRRLKRAGLDVLTAEDGEQALSIMRSEQPALVNGYDTASSRWLDGL